MILAWIAIFVYKHFASMRISRKGVYRISGHRKLSIDPLPGERLRAQMKAKGYTQAKLAEETGYSVSQVNRIIKGHCELSGYAAGKFAKKLDCRKEWLLGDDKYKTHKEYSAAKEAIAERARRELSERIVCTAFAMTALEEYLQALDIDMEYNETDDGFTVTLRQYVEKDGKEIAIEKEYTYDECAEIASQISDYAEYLIQWKLLKGGVNHGKHNT